MSVKTQNRKTLNFTTIHKRISEQGKTISELAPEYSMTEDAFIQEMKSGLGPKVFSALKKMSEKNEKARERLKTSAEKKRKNNQKMLEKKLQCSSNDDKMPECVSENTEDSPEKEIKQLLSQRTGIEEQIAVLEATIESLLKSKEEKRKEISSLTEELENVKKKIAECNGELDSKETEYQNRVDEKSKLENKLSGISEQIEILQQSNIYLVAPGYHGVKPEFGRFISTEKIDGMNVEIQKGELLINEESLDNMMLCGYYDVREYMRALDFAKLCIVHITECDQYKILVDDERISKVLTTQEIDVKL